MPKIAVTFTKCKFGLKLKSISFDDEITSFAEDFENRWDAFRGLAHLIVRNYFSLNATEKDQGIRTFPQLIGPLRNAIRNKAAWLWEVFNDKDDLPISRDEKKKLRDASKLDYSVRHYIEPMGDDSSPRVKFSSGFEFEVYIFDKSKTPENHKTRLAENEDLFGYNIGEDYPGANENNVRTISLEIEVSRNAAEKSIIVTRSGNFTGVRMNDRLAFKVISNYETKFALVWIDWNKNILLEPIYPFKWREKDDQVSIEMRRLISTEAIHRNDVMPRQMLLPKNGTYGIDKNKGLHCLFCVAINAGPNENQFRELLKALAEALDSAPRPMPTFPATTEFASSNVPIPQRISLNLDHPTDTKWSMEVLSRYKGLGNWIELIALPNIGI